MDTDNPIACDNNEIEELITLMEIPHLAEPDDNYDCNNSWDTKANVSDNDERVTSALGIFNFSMSVVCNILKQYQNNDRNVSAAAEFALILAYCLLITFGLMTNLAVIFVVVRRIHMHTARNLYIVNLTISDISLCLVCMPFTLVRLLNRRWTLGGFLCKLVPALQGANIMISTGTIAMIALDRYCTIVRRSPRNGAGAVISNRRRRVIIYIAGVWFVISVLAALQVWLVSILSVVPLAFNQRVENFAVHHLVLYQTCIEAWPSPKAKLAYTLTTLIIMYVIPIAVVIAVHARITAFLRAHATHQCSTSETTTGNTATGRVFREMARNRRTTMLLSGIAVLFAFSWLPHNILSVIVDTDVWVGSTEQLYIATAVCHLIAMSSVVSNPIVYGWLNTNIRREFISMIPSSMVTCCCCAQSSNSTTRVVVLGPSLLDRGDFGASARVMLADTTTMLENRLAPGRHASQTTSAEQKTSVMLMPRCPSTIAQPSGSTHVVSEV